MSRGAWNRAALEQIAAREGADPAAVEKWASSAGRMLRLASTDQVSALRARNVARLDEAYDLALEHEVVTADGDIHESPDIRAAVAAVAEQNKLLGLIVQKHEVSGPSAEEWQTYRTALLETLCGECKTKLLAKMRERGEPK